MNAAQQRLELLGLAQDHLHRGDVRSAITTFKQLVEQHPDDLRLQLKLAGLLREDGQFDAALWTYREVARHWEKSGFLLRAVTIYQQILEIDPGDVRARRKLAELYVHLHLRDRARATYRQLADAFAAQGNVPRRLAMLERITGCAPRMWGPSIVGHGAYRYTYASGRTGEAPLTGFAVRGRELVVYLDCEANEHEAVRARLGPHRMGKSCLYFKQLADLDRTVLEAMVVDAIAQQRPPAAAFVGEAGLLIERDGRDVGGIDFQFHTFEFTPRRIERCGH